MPSAGPQSVTPYRWVVLTALMAGNACFSLVGLALGILLPSMVAEMNLTPLESGWLGASFRLGNILLALPLGFLLSRHSPRAMITVTFVAAAVLTFGQAFAPLFGVLLACRALFGIAQTARNPSRALYLTQWFPPREIMLANGLFIGATGIAEAATLSLTPIILNLMGSWRLTFAVYGVYILAVTGLVFVLARERVTPAYREAMASQEKLSFWSVFRYKDLWLASIGAFGATFAWWAFATFWPTFMLSTYAMPLTLSGFLYGLVSLGMTLAALVVGWRVPNPAVNRMVIAACGIAMTIGSLGLMSTSSVALLVLGAAVTGLAWGFVPIAQSVPYQIPGIKPRETAVAVSFISTMFMVGGAAGPFVAGAIYQTSGSLHLALVVCAIAPLTLTATGFSLWRDKQTVPIT